MFLLTCTHMLSLDLQCILLVYEKDESPVSAFVTCKLFIFLAMFPHLDYSVMQKKNVVNGLAGSFIYFKFILLLWYSTSYCFVIVFVAWDSTRECKTETSARKDVPKSLVLHCCASRIKIRRPYWQAPLIREITFYYRSVDSQ